MDDKLAELHARNFPSAQDEALAVKPVDRYAGPESAYRLAFTLPRLFKNKTTKIGKRRRLRLLDLRFKPEPWEN